MGGLIDDQTRTQWRRLETLFLRACDLDANGRDAFLANVKDESPELAAELVDLLRSDESANADTSFLTPASPARSLVGRLREEVQKDEDFVNTLRGQVVGGFELEDVIASGGMGVVFRARQMEPERTVAVKLLHPGVFSQNIMRRFRFEAEVLARLDHPGIARVYASGNWAHEDGIARPYIAMEYVESARPLTTFAREEGLDLNQRVKLLRDAAEAVRYGHARGVIHRDLKPGNILVDRQGNVKVIDFGIARVTDDDVSRITQGTTHGEMLGTLSYMSPEQTSGDPAQIDARSDVYALGVVMYELLTDRKPHDFEGRSVPDAIRIVQTEIPESPRRLVRRADSGTTTFGAIPTDLSTIAMTALAKRPADRYTSVEAFAGDLLRFLEARPIDARPPSTAYRLRMFARRNPAGLTAIAGGLIFLVTTTIVSSTFAVALARERRDKTAALETSQEVGSFLDTVLASGDLNLTSGSVVTVRDMLTAASARVDRELDDVSAAHVYELLARSYMSHAEWEQATEHFDLAIERRRRLAGTRDASPDDVWRIQRMRILKQIPVLRQGKEAEAEAALNTLIDELAEQYGSNDAKVAFARSELARLYLGQFEYGDAERIAADALDILQASKEFGPEHLQTLTTQNILALAINDGGQPAVAEPMFDKLWRTHCRIAGKQHPRSLVARNNYGWSLFQQGRYEEAEPVFRESVEDARVTFGNDHPETAMRLANLHNALCELRRGKEAEPLIREAFEICRDHFGMNHPRTAEAVAGVGWAMQIQEQFGEALSYMTQAREIYEDIDPGSVKVARALRWEGSTLLLVGRYDDAIAVLKESLALLESTIGLETGQGVVTTNELAMCYARQEQWLEATEYFRRAYESRITISSPDHPQTLIATHNYARGRLELGDAATALPMLEECADKGQRVYGDEDFRTAIFRFNLGRACFMTGDRSRGLSLMGDNLPRLEAAFGRDATRVARARGIYEAFLESE